MAVQDQLLIDVRHDKDRVVLSLQGELDLASAPLLQAEIQGSEVESAAMLVLDLKELRFIDSTGLRVLLARARTGVRGHAGLAPGSAAVQHHGGG
jgi:anti-sigma B factor antagonist